MNTENQKNSNYEKYLLEEYKNITQAHFNVVNSISTFFKHYLLLMSLPIPLLVLLLRINSEPNIPFFKLSEPNLLKEYSLLIPLFLSLISFVGFGVMNYIINLRFDALLYARTVNGIRSYFTNESRLSFQDEFMFRVLPTSKYFPRYLESRFFGPVVFVFALFHSFYLISGWVWYIYYKVCPNIWIKWIFLFGFLFFFVHFMFYVWQARYRETYYLRKNIIGIDIDGVLNIHRKHFCSLLSKLCEKKLDPDRITKIPVHEDLENDVTEEDEHTVFNCPDYWTKMPPDKDSIDIIKKLKNVMNYRIMIFTYRPWPHPSTFPYDYKNDLEKAWKKIHTRWKKPGKAVKKITKKWLKNNNYHYDKLVIELGNIDAADYKSSRKNRFVISQKKKIRIFVEDDIFKAKKLSSICELVFLVNQPYNKIENDDVLPKNIVRVKSWNEIYKYIRETF